jgi:hypothetical protein
VPPVGAAPWLTRRVLGIGPTAPGYGNFSVSPFLDPAAPNFLGSVRGVEPIARNRSIAAAFSCNGTSSITVPAGTVAGRVTLPSCGRRIKAVAVNARPVAVALDADADAVLRDLPPGAFSFEATFAAPAGAAAVSAAVLQAL